MSSATQLGDVRHAANARRHVGFARNSKTGHRGGDATVFKDRNRASPPAGDRMIQGRWRRPVRNGERRERELSRRGDRGPPAIFMEGVEASEPSSLLVGALERAQVD